MWKIQFSDLEALWRVIVDSIDETGVRFSVLLDREPKRFEGGISWLRFRAELIRMGEYKFLNEIEQLERNLVTDQIERELFRCYNEGDKDGVDLCVKTLNGVIGKSKLGLSKLEGDRRLAETARAIRREEAELEKYDTEKLAKMLEAVTGDAGK